MQPSFPSGDKKGFFSSPSRCWHCRRLYPFFCPSSFSSRCGRFIPSHFFFFSLEALEVPMIPFPYLPRREVPQVCCPYGVLTAMQTSQLNVPVSEFRTHLAMGATRFEAIPCALRKNFSPFTDHPASLLVFDQMQDDIMSPMFRSFYLKRVCVGPICQMSTSLSPLLFFSTAASGPVQVEVDFPFCFMLIPFTRVTTFLARLPFFRTLMLDPTVRLF